MIRAQPRGLIDYHLHTGVTIDCRMKETEACEQALLQGVTEIAFTNHIMLNQPSYLMSPEACLAHWNRIQECQQEYPQLCILLGIEMDYYPGRAQEIADTLGYYEQYLGRPFDIVLGSIHELNGVFFSNKQHAPALFKDHDLVLVYHQYFELAAQAVKSRLFDVMAHPDLVKKYTGELTDPLPFAQYRAAVEPFVAALLETGVGMELNTKGLKLKVQEAYPSNELLEMYVSAAKARGAEPLLTIGSDAHIREDVGGCLLEGMQILRSVGVKKITHFKAHVGSVWEI